MDLGAWMAVGDTAGGQPCGMLLRKRPPMEREGAGAAAADEAMGCPQGTPSPWTWLRGRPWGVSLWTRPRGDGGEGARAAEEATG